ncbi:hypothetical protein [Escherichia marmotae]|uniref:Ead/Ea22-like family protein n=1 Tax=Escherichia marmotae TaxID=1499973 RepID=A0A7W2XRR4_9ESCH|nr:hypothetical protein [Escherichia marmotae]MBA7897248.1 hypothetical protein [Escherichia marmotae]QLW48388.1 hypothetical protein HV246_15275 [Escherichia marmotae]
MKPSYEELEEQLNRSRRLCDAALANERAWETAMMQACGEDGPKSVADKFAELEARCAALAAENAALKRFIKGSCYVFHGEQADISDEYSPADESPLMPDTPAIDAILEKSRALGIQIAINELVALAPSLDKRTMDAFSVAVERLRKLLKKGASSEQN